MFERRKKQRSQQAPPPRGQEAPAQPLPEARPRQGAQELDTGVGQPIPEKLTSNTPSTTAPKTTSYPLGMKGRPTGSLPRTTSYPDPLQTSSRGWDSIN